MDSISTCALSPPHGLSARLCNGSLHNCPGARTSPCSNASTTRRRDWCYEAGRKPCGKPADRRMGVPRRRRLQVASCLGRWRGMNSSNESRGGEVVVYEAPDGQVRFEVRLEREAVVAKNATTAADGKAYQVEYFNLDAILSVGYHAPTISMQLTALRAAADSGRVCRTWHRACDDSAQRTLLFMKSRRPPRAFSEIPARAGCEFPHAPGEGVRCKRQTLGLGGIPG